MLLTAVLIEIWPQEYSCGLCHDDGHGHSREEVEDEEMLGCVGETVNERTRLL